MTSPVLLLVDFQKGFDIIASRTRRNNIEAEARAMALLTFWREKGCPVIHVRRDATDPQSPFRPGFIGNQAMSFAAEEPGEPVLRRTANSAFIGTDLAERLDAFGRPQIVVAGAPTDHSISTTVRMGADLSYRMTLAADACFTFDRQMPDGSVIPAETVHAAHIASLSEELARVTTSATLIAEMGQTLR